MNSARLSEQNIRICCRIRPVMIGPEEKGAGVVVEKEDDKHLALYDPRHKGTDRRFQFDRVYMQEDTLEIFEAEIGSHVSRLFDGHCLTVFAHGASGSGKTFTMEGAGAENSPDNCALGLTPLSVEMIFRCMDGDLPGTEKTKRREDYEVRFSLYEIYCEKVRDLLRDTKDGDDRKYDVGDLPIQKDLAGFEMIPDLVEVPISSVDEFWELYQRRILLRKKGRTLLNEESSRSHAFCVVKVVKKGTGGGDENFAKLGRNARGGSSMTFHERPRPPQTGRLFLVDLAGCEDNRMSGNSGVRMLESQAINDTYLALVKVFHALKRRQALSAFCRDAKLTRLLRGALECKSSPCLVMITVSPSRFRFQATLNTFSYLQLNGVPLDGDSVCNVSAEVESSEPADRRGALKRNISFANPTTAQRRLLELPVGNGGGSGGGGGSASARNTPRRLKPPGAAVEGVKTRPRPASSCGDASSRHRSGAVAAFGAGPNGGVGEPHGTNVARPKTSGAALSSTNLGRMRGGRSENMPRMRSPRPRSHRAPPGRPPDLPSSKKNGNSAAPRAAGTRVRGAGGGGTAEDGNKVDQDASFSYSQGGDDSFHWGHGDESFHSNEGAGKATASNDVSRDEENPAELDEDWTTAQALQVDEYEAFNCIGDEAPDEDPKSRAKAAAAPTTVGGVTSGGGAASSSAGRKPDAHTRHESERRKELNSDSKVAAGTPGFGVNDLAVGASLSSSPLVDIEPPSQKVALAPPENLLQQRDENVDENVEVRRSSASASFSKSKHQEPPSFAPGGDGAFLDGDPDTPGGESNSAWQNTQNWSMVNLVSSRPSTRGSDYFAAIPPGEILPAPNSPVREFRDFVEEQEHFGGNTSSSTAEEKKHDPLSAQGGSTRSGTSSDGRSRDLASAPAEAAAQASEIALGKEGTAAKPIRSGRDERKKVAPQSPRVQKFLEQPDARSADFATRVRAEESLAQPSAHVEDPDTIDNNSSVRSSEAYSDREADAGYSVCRQEDTSKETCATDVGADGTSSSAEMAEPDWRKQVAQVEQNVSEIRKQLESRDQESRRVEPDDPHESVRDSRLKQIRHRLEQNTKIRPPKQQYKASQEILNGMKSCLRPPTTVRRAAGGSDLSTTKIVRDYFQSQEQMDPSKT
ncbi:unnamed protein product [Amoebophrya sp. A25]|nr:unnamed protein product [Amoebophrya sp. A25]|eukprot:GSA25T00021574001.1